MGSVGSLDECLGIPSSVSTISSSFLLLRPSQARRVAAP